MKECDIFRGSKHTLTLSYIFSGTFRLCVYISCCHSRRHMYKSSFAMCPTLMSLQIVECAETFVTQQTPVLSYHPSGFSCECTELLPAYRLCHTNDIRKISLPCALSSAYTDCWTDWMTCHTSDSCTVSLHCVLCRARRGCATLQTVCHKRHNCTAYPVHPRGLSCNEDADVPTEWINTLLHVWHLYGFSPLWILPCTTSAPCLTNRLPQTVHPCRLSPAWLSGDRA